MCDPVGMKVLFFVFLVRSLQAVKPLPGDLSPEAEAHHSAAVGLNVSDSIPEILRSVWSEDEAFSQVRGTFGISVLRLYVTKDTDEIFVIAGDRFGLGQLKVTMGGQIDAADETVSQTYQRELEEGYFGQLLDREVQPLTLEGRVTQITGGVFLKRIKGGRPMDGGPASVGLSGSMAIRKKNFRTPLKL